MVTKQKLGYLARCLLHAGQKKTCPYCGGSEFDLIDKKYLVTSLIKCRKCHLNHRHPRDSRKWLEKFYQVEYDIDVSMMTKLPDENEIEALKKSNFASLRNYSEFIHALFKGERLKVLDYGCSWGYNVFQYNSVGHDAIGFEVSRPRAEFGIKKLGVPIFCELDQIRTDNNVIISSHVIEHLFSIAEFLDFSKKHLCEEGVFIAFCPNGSKEYKEREFNVFHVNWGEVHPNYLDIDFAKYLFKDNPYIILTGDWEYEMDLLESWDGASQVVGSRAEGKELLIIAKPNRKI